MKINLTFDIVEEMKTQIKWKRKWYVKNTYTLKELLNKIIFRKEKK